MDAEIVVGTKDDEGEDADGLYCAIVMQYHRKTWVNSGIVVREDTPEKAFTSALRQAIEHGLWK